MKSCDKCSERVAGERIRVILEGKKETVVEVRRLDGAIFVYV